MKAGKDQQNKTATNTQLSERVTLDSGGRLVVPARFRRTLDLRPGDAVTVTLEGNMLRVKSVRVALRQAQALMRKKNSAQRSVVDELIAERRAEAAQE